MNIMAIVIVAVVAFVILAIGGGFGYWFWISTRPKKMTWKARVWQVGDGTVTAGMDNKGIKIANYKLSALREYTYDIVEKIDKKSGATHYWLQKMKKAVPVVTADCVEVWGQNEKWVNVLLEGDTCTLLKSHYDRKLGEAIFRPMPHDRINMIKTEIQERKERIENTKDILAQITPFIVVGIAMLALVAIGYFMVQGGVKIAELNIQAAETAKGGLDNYANSVLQLYGCQTGEELPPIEKEEPPTIPP